jgi:prolyl oligopeptidase
MRHPTLLALLAVAAAGPAATAKPARPPAAPKHPVEDTYHGVKVVDDYRWLENAADPMVKKWAEAQTAWAQAQLDALPGVKELTARLLQIDDARPPAFWPFRIGDKWYADKIVPGKRLPVLVSLPGPEATDQAKPLLDFNAIDPRGLTSPDFTEISLDGRVAAISLSEMGSEAGTLHVYDLATGKPLADTIPGVNRGTGGGDAAWLADGSGFFYTRYPKKGERPDADLDFYQQVWLHRMGQPEDKDVYVVGKEWPRVAEASFVASIDYQRLAIAVRNGDGGEVGYWLRSGDKFTQVARFEDRIISARFGMDGSLYLLSLKDAPQGKILRLPPDAADLARAQVIVPEGNGRIERFLATKSRLYVASLVGGPTELRAYELDGKGAEMVPLPPVAGVGLLTRLGPDSDEILFSAETYVEPTTVYRWAPGGKPTRSSLTRPSPIDFSGYEVERVMVTSRDGTQVPLNLIHKKGMARDGKNPVILTGYGGYGIAQTPYFSPWRIAWLEQGGVYAEANLRGGTEFGEKWHEQGKLTHKQNVFDDFLACAQWLIDNKVTSPPRLGIEGGSNGGLLMGAALTQRPELFGAVVSWVGVYDMLRSEQSSNGQFNITEYGTVKDPEQFKALYAYSPYHRVRDGAKYPPLLLMTGENDPRVDPMQSRKLAARLGAAGARDVLLLSNKEAGHGIPERVQAFKQEAYALAFMLDRLHVPYHKK